MLSQVKTRPPAQLPFEMLCNAVTHWSSCFEKTDGLPVEEAAEDVFVEFLLPRNFALGLCLLLKKHVFAHPCLLT